MGMFRCYSVMKCLLILFNIVLLCVGVCACSVAAWALWEGGAAESGEGRAGLALLAAWGGVLALGALAALGGAARGSPGALAAAFALLALTAVAEAAAAWWGAAHVPQLRTALSDRLLHTVHHDYGAVHSRTQILDAIQQGLRCCGANGVRDWQSSAWTRAQAGQQADAGGGAGSALDLSVGADGSYYRAPPSCCQAVEEASCEEARTVPASSSGKAGLHGDGCAPLVLAALAEYARYPLWAGGALLAVHALALLLALALCLRVPARHHKA